MINFLIESHKNHAYEPEGIELEEISIPEEMTLSELQNEIADLIDKMTKGIDTKYIQHEKLNKISKLTGCLQKASSKQGFEIYIDSCNKKLNDEKEKMIEKKENLRQEILTSLDSLELLSVEFSRLTKLITNINEALKLFSKHSSEEEAIGVTSSPNSSRAPDITFKAKLNLPSEILEIPAYNP